MSSKENLLQSVSAVSCRFVFGSLLFLTATTGNAQVPSPDGTEMVAGDFVMGVRPEFPVIGNHWNLLQLMLINKHNRPVDLQVAIYFDVDPDAQYSRRVEIPPTTRVRTWLPVFVPNPRHIVDRAYPYHILVRSLGDSTGLLPDQFGSLQLDRTLQVESDEPGTGLIHTPAPLVFLDTEIVKPEAVDAFEFVMTGRYARGVRRNWITLAPGFASGAETGLDGLDHLVLANDALLDDPAGQQAVRRWLFGGGHLWVMLDRVDSRILELLLGDRFQGQEVERVELTSIDLVDKSGRISSGREYDSPIAMTRLLIENADVRYSVDGWPAALTIDFGQGHVLITTLGGNAWVRPRLASDRSTMSGTGWETTSIPQLEFEEIITPLFATDEPTPEIRPALGSQIEGYIGFQIPSQSSVVAVLLGYSSLSIVIAGWLWKIRRIPLFGVLGPVCALLAAATLLGIRPAGNDVPSTAVVSQLVTPITGTDDVRAQGVVGLYAADASPIELSGDLGSWMMPDRDSFRSGIRILTFDDQNTWEWEKLRNQPGLHNAGFEWSGQKERIRAVATFDELGLSGTLTLPDQTTPADAIVDAVQGRIGALITPDGKWRARQRDTFSNEQFLSADLLGDEQRRRVSILRQLLATPARAWNSDHPHLLFWTRPWDLDFRYSDRFQQQGSALVAIPLEFRRPPAGRRITIPAPLLPYREVVGPDGKEPASIYSYKNQEWLEKKYATSTWIGFDIPSVLLPMSIDQVNVEIAVTGPVGQLELWRWDGRERESLRRWDNPVGTLSATFDADSGLTISEDGRLVLFLSAGDGEFDASAAAENPRSNWRIESMNLWLEGTLQEPVP